MDDRSLDALNPLRPSDWRYQLAQQLDKEQRFISKREHDDATCCIARYLRARRQHDVGALRRVADRRDIQIAHEIFTAAPRLRAAIEAAVLTGADPASIAAKVGIPLKCLQLYEAVFWDVRERLPAAAFIVHEIIASGREENAATSDQVGSKLRAYLVTGTTLEEAMNIEKCESVRHLMAALGHETQLGIQEKLRSSAQALTVDHAMAAKLLPLAVGGAGKSSEEPLLNSYERNVKAMMETIRFSIGPGEDENSPFWPYDQSAVDLNHHELMLLAAGVTLPHGEMLQSLAFPDATEPSSDNRNAQELE